MEGLIITLITLGLGGAFYYLMVKDAPLGNKKICVVLLARKGAFGKKELEFFQQWKRSIMQQLKYVGAQPYTKTLQEGGTELSIKLDRKKHDTPIPASNGHAAVVVEKIIVKITVPVCDRTLQFDFSLDANRPGTWETNLISPDELVRLIINESLTKGEVQ